MTTKILISLKVNILDIVMNHVIIFKTVYFEIAIKHMKKMILISDMAFNH